jgi:hypothetical protein
MPVPGDYNVSARTGYPDTIVIGGESVLRLRLVRDGAAVAPDDVGGFELLDSAGLSVLTDTPTYDPGGFLLVTILAAASAALAVGYTYQSRWTPTINGEASARTFRREAIVAPILLVPPISDEDLTAGTYPDLVSQLGEFANTGASGEATLQAWIDEAWGWTIRRILKTGRWPDQIVSTQDLVEVTRERAWFAIFRFLFRASRGEAGVSRYESLMKQHETGFESEFRSLSAHWDFDNDGIADSAEREVVQGALHFNGAPRRRLSRRW